MTEDEYLKICSLMYAAVDRRADAAHCLVDGPADERYQAANREALRAQSEFVEYASKLIRDRT